MSLSAIQDARPEIAIVLGSGLADTLRGWTIEAEISHLEVPGLPRATVPGHAGRFCLVRVADKSVLVSLGRVHAYEGYSAREVAAPVRFMADLGIKSLILTNAAGAINPSTPPGHLMRITDHINLTGASPLTGGAQFIDMTEAYSHRLGRILHTAALDAGVPLLEGVYAAVNGPQYETPAEVRMLRTLGADAVGMSTVHEVIQARALGLEVAAISALTNWAAGLQETPLHHEDVLKSGKAAARDAANLLTRTMHLL